MTTSSNLLQFLTVFTVSVLLSFNQCEGLKISVSSKFLTPSYFSRIPPYLRFQSIDQEPIPIPEEIKKYLLWPAVEGPRRKELHDTSLLAAGHKILSRKELATTKLPLLGWLRKPHGLKYKVSADQKVNSFPGMIELSHKDSMSAHFRKFSHEHSHNANPYSLPTFVLPEQLEEFKKAWENTKDKLWISKGPKSSSGRDIVMMAHWREYQGKERRVVQKYVHNPILHDNLKIGFSYNFLVTSVHPLRVYSLPESLHVSLAASNYSILPEKAHDLCIHGLVTFLDIECEREKFYGPNGPSSVEFDGIVSEVNNKYNLDKLLYFMDEAVILALISAENHLTKLFYQKAKNRYNFYHILSADFVVDETGKPWLIEINSSPLRTMKRTWLADRHQEFYSEFLNIAGYHLPKQLSPEAQNLTRAYLSLHKTVASDSITFEESLYSIALSTDETEKHIKFETDAGYKHSLLKNLTIDDIRMLLITEDELHRVKFGKRIFPRCSLAKYLPLITSSKYYYKLLDAWETQYREQRSDGRALLEKLSRKVI